MQSCDCPEETLVRHWVLLAARGSTYGKASATSNAEYIKTIPRSWRFLLPPELPLAPDFPDDPAFPGIQKSEDGARSGGISSIMRFYRSDVRTREIRAQQMFQHYRTADGPQRCAFVTRIMLPSIIVRSGAGSSALCGVNSCNSLLTGSSGRGSCG